LGLFKKIKNMKLKILQLLLLFLSTGLLVSSKGTVSKSKKNCSIKCTEAKSRPVEKKEKKKKQSASYPYALAPGSYIFYY